MAAPERTVPVWKNLRPTGASTPNTQQGPVSVSLENRRHPGGLRAEPPRAQGDRGGVPSPHAPRRGKPRKRNIKTPKVSEREATAARSSAADRFVWKRAAGKSGQV
ncbi:unnamed protein product [Coccothraustes coccothraustes]